MRKKVVKPLNWIAVVHLYGLWEMGRSQNEMLGYNQFLNSVARKIAILSQRFDHSPSLILLCGGKTRTDIPELSGLSEAGTCIIPFIQFLEQNGIGFTDQIFLVEDTLSTMDNIIKPAEILRRYGFKTNSHLIIFSDKVRAAKTAILCQKYIRPLA